MAENRVAPLLMYALLGLPLTLTLTLILTLTLTLTRYAMLGLPLLAPGVLGLIPNAAINGVLIYVGMEVSE